MADKHPIAPAPRLVLQTFAVAAVLAALPPELRLLPVLPWWGERLLLLVGLLWFVNLVNFMDGMDWLTVMEVVPITAASGVRFVRLSCHGRIVLAWRCAARRLVLLFSIGRWRCFFSATWQSSHRPSARLALAGARRQRRAAPPRSLLPLYYLADSTITLFRRAVRSEPVWQAHRSHFYQRATDNGFRVIEVGGPSLGRQSLTRRSRARDNSAAVANDGHYHLKRWRSALTAGILAVFTRGPRRAE